MQTQHKEMDPRISPSHEAVVNTTIYISFGVNSCSLISNVANYLGACIFYSPDFKAMHTHTHTHIYIYKGKNWKKKLSKSSFGHYNLFLLATQ